MKIQDLSLLPQDAQGAIVGIEHHEVSFLQPSFPLVNIAPDGHRKTFYRLLLFLVLHRAVEQKRSASRRFLPPAGDDQRGLLKLHRNQPGMTQDAAPDGDDSPGMIKKTVVLRRYGGGHENRVLEVFRFSTARPEQHLGHRPAGGGLESFDHVVPGNRARPLVGIASLKTRQDLFRPNTDIRFDRFHPSREIVVEPEEFRELRRIDAAVGLPARGCLRASQKQGFAV